jgi:hypothetical protein
MLTYGMIMAHGSIKPRRDQDKIRVKGPEQLHIFIYKLKHITVKGKNTEIFLKSQHFMDDELEFRNFSILGKITQIAHKVSTRRSCLHLS